MRSALIVVLLVFCGIYFCGCESDAQTGALIGTAIGAGVGQAAGGDTESTMIGAAVGGGSGYLIGKHSDDKKEEEAQQGESQEVQTVWITNSNGSQTPVKIIRQGDKYVGPKGEMYTTFPTEEQLKSVYGF
ncbi:MAG: glycine zipper domain-containing protein [Sedimentisphaeraceae bacterium JB056]